MENKQVKLTKTQKFNYLIALLQNNDLEPVMMDTADMEVSTDDLVEFLQHEVELIAKKGVKSKGAKAEDTMKSAIQAMLDADAKPCKDFVNALTEQGFEDVTSAKVTARLSALVRDGLADKTPIKVGKSTLQHYSAKAE